MLLPLTTQNLSCFFCTWLQKHQNVRGSFRRCCLEEATQEQIPFGQNSNPRQQGAHCSKLVYVALNTAGCVQHVHVLPYTPVREDHHKVLRRSKEVKGKNCGSIHPIQQQSVAMKYACLKVGPPWTSFLLSQSRSYCHIAPYVSTKHEGVSQQTSRAVLLPENYNPNCQCVSNTPI